MDSNMKFKFVPGVRINRMQINKPIELLEFGLKHPIFHKISQAQVSIASSC